MKNSWMLSSFMRLIMINGPIAANIRPLIPRWSCRKCQEWKCQLSKRTWQVLKWGLERQQRRQQRERQELAGWWYTFRSFTFSNLITQFLIVISLASSAMTMSPFKFLSSVPFTEAKDLVPTKWMTLLLRGGSSTLSFRNLFPIEKCHFL